MTKLLSTAAILIATLTTHANTPIEQEFNITSLIPNADTLTEQEFEIEMTKIYTIPAFTVLGLYAAFQHYPQILTEEAKTIKLSHNLNIIKQRVTQSAQKISKVIDNHDQELDHIDHLMLEETQKTCQKIHINLTNMEEIYHFMDILNPSKKMNMNIRQFIRCALLSFDLQSINTIDELIDFYEKIK